MGSIWATHSRCRDFAKYPSAHRYSLGVPNFIEVPLGDGEVILARLASENEDDVMPFGRGRDSGERLAASLSTGLSKVRVFAAEVLNTLRESAEPPERIAVEFGLELSGKSGVVIAESSATGHMTVTMEWSRKGQAASAGPDGA
jgi:hypothetical protein